jgi:peptide deformylase
MTARPVVIGPDIRLNTIAEPIREVNAEIRQLVDDMVDTMRVEHGSGLAANQIGVLKRVFVMDISSYIPANKELYVLINPEVTYRSDKTWKAVEGCLSLPGIDRIEVERPEAIKVKFLDYNGVEREMSAEGWLARGFLHEIDHLNGITLIEHVKSPIKRDIYIRKLEKFKRINCHPR